MKAFKYIRVSDDEQYKEGFSIEAQEALLTRKFVEWGWECVGTYVDPGYSAKNMKRPDFQKMLKEVESKGAEVIAFWRLDRFTRSTRDFQKIVELLESKHCGIRSATESYDTTTAIGRFQLDLAISLGQLERETTAERVKFVMEERHRKGLRNGAVAPYGYELIDGDLIINLKEAEIVRRVYNLYQSPMSTRAIAKLFNSEGLLRRNGGYWNDFSIYSILSNPVYCGRLRWNYRRLAGKRTHQEIIVNGKHEPIISPEEYDLVEQIRNKRAIRREKISSDFHFTGVLRCGRCGYGMIGLTQRDNKTGKSRRFYRCLGRANYGICNMPLLSEPTVTEAFLSALQTDSIQYKKLIVVNDSVPVEKDYEQESVKRDLEAVQRRRRKWQEAYANEVITLDDLKVHMDEERAKEEALKAKLEPAATELKSQWSHDEIMELIASFRELWFTIEDELAKKAFIQEAFKEIVINTPVERAVARPGKLIPCNIMDWKLNI